MRSVASAGVLGAALLLASCGGFTINTGITFPDNSNLIGVSCPSKDVCTTVGNVGGFGLKSLAVQGFVAKWSGGIWTPVLVPPGPRTGAATSDLFSVACASPVFCMAVGDYEPRGKSASTPLTRETFAEEWTGGHWTVLPTPNPQGKPATAENVLAGISCLSTRMCMAVGRSSSGSIAERWDGHSWSLLRTPSTGALLGVSCTSPQACVAVGVRSPGNSGTTFSLAEHWDGVAWTEMTTPNPTAESQSEGTGLNSVSCVSARDCLAVGGSAFSIASQPFSLRLRDGRWSLLPRVPVPFAGASGAALNGVACPSENVCFAVGGYSDNKTIGHALADMWDGRKWVSQRLPSERDTTYAAISCTSVTWCIAVGSSGLPFGVADRWNGRAWISAS